MIHDFFPYFDKTELGELHTYIFLSLSLSHHSINLYLIQARRQATLAVPILLVASLVV